MPRMLLRFCGATDVPQLGQRRAELAKRPEAGAQARPRFAVRPVGLHQFNEALYARLLGGLGPAFNGLGHGLDGPATGALWPAFAPA